MPKRLKKLLLTGSLLSMALFLTGCMSRTSTGNPTGWFYEFLVVPTINVIDWLAGLLGSNYGLAIILFTIIIRLIILPLTIKQQKGAAEQQVKMNMVKEITKDIQDEMNATDDPARKAELNQEIMKIYSQAGISLTGGIGCLPLLIQLPIISMVFQAINYSPEIANATFLGMHLGTRSIVLAVVAGLVYFIQSKLSMKDMPAEQQDQMRMMMLMNPIMILFFSMSSSAGIALYWIIGGIFSIIQTYFINTYIKPKVQAEAEENLGDIVIERPERREAEKVNEEPVNATQEKQITHDKRRRNEGLQKDKKR